MSTKRGTHAWLGSKPCGCATFARLMVPFNTVPLEKAARGLNVRRVPVQNATVVICRCS